MVFTNETHFTRRAVSVKVCCQGQLQEHSPGRGRYLPLWVVGWGEGLLPGHLAPLVCGLQNHLRTTSSMDNFPSHATSCPVAMHAGRVSRCHMPMITDCESHMQHKHLHRPCLQSSKGTHREQLHLLEHILLGWVRAVPATKNIPIWERINREPRITGSTGCTVSNHKVPVDSQYQRQKATWACRLLQRRYGQWEAGEGGLSI